MFVPSDCPVLYYLLGPVCSGDRVGVVFIVQSLHPWVGEDGGTLSAEFFLFHQVAWMMVCAVSIDLSHFKVYMSTPLFSTVDAWGVRLAKRE